MNQATVKQLLESGVFQAYAEGKPIQVKRKGSSDTWKDYRYHSQLDQDQAAFETDYWEWRVKPEKKTGWINIYPSKASIYPQVNLYSTKAAADSFSTKERIACIEITYEEGEGL